MEKNWYLFIENHSHGPYAPEEIIEMLEEEKITTTSLVGRVGYRRWRVLKDCHELFVKPQPKMPSEQKDLRSVILETIKTQKLKEIKHTDEVNKYDEDEKVEAIEEVEEVEVVKESAEEKEILGDPEQLLKTSLDLNSMFQVSKEMEQHAIETSRFLKKDLFSVARVFLGAAIILIISTSLFLMLVPSKLKNYQNSISPEEFARVQELIDYRGGDKIEIDFFLRSKANEIIAASNLQGPALVYVTLKSIQGKTLDDSEVPLMIKSKGVLENNFVTFSDLIIEQGYPKIVPGYYSVEVRGIKIGVWAKISKFFNLESEEFYFTGETLLAGEDRVKFEEKLLNFQTKLNVVRRQFFNDLIQRYTTFNSFLDKYLALYKWNLKKFTKGSSVKYFVSRYSKQLGPMFTSLVQNNVQKYNITLNEHQNVTLGNIDKSKEYRDVLSFSAQVGKFVVAVIEDTRKNKKLMNRTKKELINKASLEVSRFKKISKMRIIKIENRLRQMNN